MRIDSAMKYNCFSLETLGENLNGKVTGLTTPKIGLQRAKRKQVGAMRTMEHSSCVLKTSGSISAEYKSVESVNDISIHSSKPVTS